jgi:two-component sensor histidine kinase
MEDEKAQIAFSEASNRVLAMSEVYERLYRSDEVSAVDLGGYINELATTLVGSSLGDASRVGLVLDAEPVAIDIKRAISLGLILNELVTNVLKYAFPGGRAGTLRIRLRSTEGSICLGVEDDGVGMPAGFDVAKSDSLGTKLVALLVEQLGASMRYLEGGGTRVEICFPE